MMVLMEHVTGVKRIALFSRTNYFLPLTSFMDPRLNPTIVHMKA